MDDGRNDSTGDPTSTPAGPDAESQDVTAQIGERPPFGGGEPPDPDAPANGVLDPSSDDPPEPNEPA
ncbi:MAG: hypothetical protein JF603_01340 [Acidobacteria bacterium]|nr:hypothetical protein [Acidobacteriota bacterium]